MRDRAKYEEQRPLHSVVQHELCISGAVAASDCFCLPFYILDGRTESAVTI